MPELVWYGLGALAYCGFVGFMCLVAAVCSDESYPQPEWLDEEYARLCERARELDSEGE